MALDPADLAEIAHLVEERLAAHEAARRRQRRRWLIPLMLLGGVLATALSVGLVIGVRSGQDWLAARDAELTEAKLAYQRELARNQAWQAQREAAAKAVHYDTTKTQAQHEAALMNQALGLMAEQGALKAKWAALDYNDPKSMEVLSDDLSRVLGQGLGTIGQVLLRNTDPAHNTREERLRQDAAGEVLAPEAPLKK